MMEYINSYTFDSYFEHIQALFAENKTTGSDYSEEKMDATKINIQRIKRLGKTAKLDEAIHGFILDNAPHWNWTLIVEAWCGDAAQISPYLNKIAELGNDISLEIILRDENLDIMDQYLTNNARAIPILICQNKKDNKVLGHWGPRPARIIDWITQFKAENPNFDPDVFKKELHAFYAKDNGKAINEDILLQMKKWVKAG